MVQVLGRVAREESPKVILAVIEHVRAGITILRQKIPAHGTTRTKTCGTIERVSWRFETANTKPVARNQECAHQTKGTGLFGLPYPLRPASIAGTVNEVRWPTAV